MADSGAPHGRGRAVARGIWLGLVSGAADAVGWIGSGVFPAHMTGNTALIGVALAGGHPGAAAIRAAVIATFFAGLLLSPLLGMEERLGTPAAIWGASAAALLASFVPGRLADTLLLALALAMQNAALHQFRGRNFNTSFLTGNLQSLAAALSRRLLGRARAGEHVTFRVVPSIWLAYVGGAGLGAAFAHHLRAPLLPISLAIPVVLLLIGRDRD